MARYSSGHKQQSRERILAEAMAGYREQGFERFGLQRLMKRAGLTHGAFYAHFKSKEDLVAEALGSALRQARSHVAARAAHLRNGTRLARLIRAYLTPEHRDDPSAGCTVAALGSEMSRLGTESKVRLAPEIENWIQEYVEAGAAGRDEAATIISAMIGAMQLARVLPDEEDSRRLLAGVERVLRERLAETGESDGDKLGHTRGSAPSGE